MTQAQYFLNIVNQNGGLTDNDLPPMLDIECPTSSVQSQASASCEYSGNSGWAQPATMYQRIFDWLDTVEKATGRKSIIYSYPSWFGDVGFTDPKLTAYPLFIATYGTCASVPAPWTTAVFWQYSGSGTVSGVMGACDLDRFFGTTGDLTKFIQSTLPPADMAGPTDLAGARDLASAPRTDGGADGGIHPSVRGGCSCELATSSRVPSIVWLSIVVIALFSLRRYSRAH